MAMSFTFLLAALAQFILGLVVAALLGPEAFGLYALAMAAAVLVQTGFFEWLRLAATRHHHRHAPILRARLSRLQVIGLALALGVAMLLFMAGYRLYAMIPLVAGCAGFADLRAAFFRAEFAQRHYAMQVGARVGLSIILMPLAAWMLRSPEAVLSAFALAVALPALLPGTARESSEGKRDDKREDMPLAALARYALPIIGTNLLYLALFFGLRLAVAWEFGLAAAGVFSLALDVGLKLVTTFGSALDLWLFQLAVREAREAGDATAQARLRGNAGLIISALSAVMLGMALVLPSFAEVATSTAFREGFIRVMLGLLPGLLLYGIVQYALHPFQQISEQTGHLFRAASLAIIIAGVSLMIVPSEFGSAIALGAAMTGAALSLACRLTLSMPELAKGLCRLVLALGAMALPCLALQMLLPPGWLALASIAISGAISFGVAAYGLDALGIRTRRSALF